MTETGFDWRRLAASAPEVHAEPQRSAPALPIGRWLAIGGLVVAGVLSSVLLAIGAPSPEVTIDGGSEVKPAGNGDLAVAETGAPPAAPITVDVDGAVRTPRSDHASGWEPDRRRDHGRGWLRAGGRCSRGRSHQPGGHARRRRSGHGPRS